jgi:hypothetical protein
MQQRYQSSAMKEKLVVETTVSMLTLYENGVAQMHFKDGITMDIPEQLEHLKGLIKLTHNKPTPFIITAGKFVNFTKEAKEHALVLENQSPVCASAIIVSNLAYRLLADFFIRMQKPKTPYKTFTNHEKAVDWCKQFVTSTLDEG